MYIYVICVYIKLRYKDIFISTRCQGFGSLTQEFVTYTCFDDDTLILHQSFLINKLFSLPSNISSFSFKQGENLLD